MEQSGQSKWGRRAAASEAALLHWSVLAACLVAVLAAALVAAPMAFGQELPDSPGTLWTNRVTADTNGGDAGAIDVQGSFQVPGNQTSQTAQHGANQAAQQGANQAAQQGANEAAQQGANEAAQQGANEAAQQGANEAAQREADREKLPLCSERSRSHTLQTSPPSVATGPCRTENPNQLIVSSKTVTQLDARHKARLAIRDVIDPFNLLTIAGYSAVAVGSNAHSAFGPGFEGWGRLSGYSLVEDAQGEFFGTFLISSLAHEDPRYHRMPNASTKRRVLHALAHTWVSQHDNGTRMPNYATLLTYPISAELSNLYVPGVQTNAASTVKRVSIGLVTDPSGTLVAEFLPDFARRIHIHVIFIQEILNQVITGGTAPNVQ